MSGLPRRVAFITNTPLLEFPAGLYSPHASVRREILIPAQVLAARGIATHVISLPLWPTGQVDAIVDKADRIVFGKLLMHDGETPETAYRANAQAYREVLARAPAAASSIFCFADDHFDAPEFARFYRDAAPTSAAWVASSEALQAVLHDKARCPLYVYPEVAEGPAGAPRVPRRGWSVGLAVAAARRLRIGLDPWRLRLLWFGHPTNVPSLLDALPELRALAREIPLRLECVTEPGGGLEALTRRQPGIVSEALKILVRPWSLDYMPLALHDCHAVILPQHAHDPKKRAKSNNRMVDAINAGRFVVAQPIPSYQALKDFAWVGDSIADGLRWLLAHPAQALRRVVAGQEHVAREHSLEALGDFWLRALDIDASTRPAPPVTGDETMKQPGEAYLRWYYDTAVWKRLSYRGVRTLKNPLDLWNYQEIIAEHGIEWVVETGTRHGGSALFFADLLAARGAAGLVISVDIDHDSLQAPQHDRVRLLMGDSASSAILDAIRALLPERRAPMFVILDSDHSKAHVLRELAAYVALMRSGDYLVVEDTCVNGHPVRPDFGPGPMEAIEEFLASNPDLLIPDRAREEKFGCTFAPRGYYRKK